MKREWLQMPLDERILESLKRKEEMRRIDNELPHVVYFAGRDNSLKIGYCRKELLYTRMKQIGNVGLLGYIDCDNKDHAVKAEDELHRRFRKFKITGEWFEKDKVVEIINNAIKEKGEYGFDIDVAYDQEIRDVIRKRLEEYKKPLI